MSDVTGLTVFKYQMPVLESFSLELPAGAKIIRVADQGGMFWMWALVDTEAPLETRHFIACKTGGKIVSQYELKYMAFALSLFRWNLDSTFLKK